MAELSLEEQREAADAALDTSIQEHVDDILGEEPGAPLEPEPGDTPAAEAQPDEPGEVTPSPEDEAADRGDGRDTAGRFAKASAKADEATGDTPAPAPATEPPTEPGAATPEEEYVEAAYRADGQEFHLPGSAIGEEGVYIPTDLWPRVAQMLSSAHSYHAHSQDQQTRLEQSEARADAAESGIAFMVDEIEKLVETGDFATWLENTKTNWQALKSQAQLVQEKSRREYAERRLESGTATRQEHQQTAAFEQQLEDIILERGAKYEGLDLQKVYARLHRQLIGGVFFAAADDDATGRWRKGDVLVNYPLIDEELRELHELTAGAGEAASKAITASAAAVRGATAPATVSATGTPLATDDATASRPKTRAEADALMTKTARRLARGGSI